MEHYYSAQPKSELKISKFKQKISGFDFEFCTSSGVFSKNKIDKGTLTLAENMLISKNSKVLDIGCGIGVIGIVAAKIFNADVVMSDVNKRAVMLAKRNAELNKVRATVLLGNLYSSINENEFDVILSNPPQSAGKEACFKLIEESKDYLRHGGTLQLVARHNKGGKTLRNKMEEVFGNIWVISKKSGYWVYSSKKMQVAKTKN